MRTIRTPITEMFGIDRPIILAGMNKAAGPDLAAAVSNNGGLGVIGGVFYTPRMLRIVIRNLKKKLDRPDLPFGIDLLLPQVGGSARATNKDYTKGNLNALVDVVIDSGAKLFVSAVGVPPKDVVQRCHENGILVMNMVGHPKHVLKALDCGVDLICAQGGEGGGHTGHVPTSLLIPACVDLCKGHVSPLTGKPVYVVAAGGIYDGRGIAMSLSLGAQAVWVGTRFVAAKEAGASPAHKEALLKATYDDTTRSLIYTGRPLRIIKNSYQKHWETRRTKEMNDLLKKGVVPVEKDQERMAMMAKMQKKRRAASVAAGGAAGKKKKGLNPAAVTQQFWPHLCGQVCGAITEVEPAGVIMDKMMAEAVEIMDHWPKMVVTSTKAKL